ncbi:MAG: flagellar export protein FliJ [Eubacteriales bacterium]|nr:flagellar export protein FliJ [Eubacteriales bacterium]NCC80706.1 flagellar export protein FliJ [Clostridia bacterium]
MARFKFRLDILLRLAQNKEEEAKKELASWQKQLLEAQEKLQKILIEITSSLNEKSAKRNINEILLYEAYLESLRNQQKKTENEIEYFTVERNKAILKLQETIKERKILEKLKEKKLEQYIFDENQKEQKEADEVGSKIFIDGR